MSDMGIEYEESVAIVRWRAGENRFGAETIAQWHAVLDELQHVEGPLAVVVTGDGKFFSNGLDLDSLAQDPATAGEAIDQLHRLFGRLLLFPAYTVAAINGHVFAAGAMFAACLDYRIMREDRGYWCLPEADLGLPLTPAMLAAVTSHMPIASAAEAMNTARRYSAADAHAYSIVEETASAEGLMEAATRRAASVAGKDRRVIAEHKRMLFGEAARVCGYIPT